LQSPAVSLDKTPDPDVNPEPEPTRHVLRAGQDGGLLFALGHSPLPPFVAPRLLTRCVAAALILLALVCWVAVGVSLAHLRQIRLLLSGAAIGALSLSQVANMLQITQRVQIGVLALTAILFLAWLYRMRVNLRALGVRKPDYGRHWAVLGFLVPAVNFVRPYQVISEVCRASDPSVLDRFEWKRVEPPRLLLVWWASVVIAASLELAAFGLAETAGVIALKALVASGIAVLAHAAAAISASLGYFVVTRLGAAQIAKYELLRDEDVAA
jgi:hypothetical protein